MKINVNGQQLFYTTNDLFNALDSKDGVKDGQVKAKEWNEFAQIAGGRTIKYCILEENAVKSINAYLNRSNDEIKVEMLRYLGLDIGSSAKIQEKSKEPVKATKPQPDVAQKTQPQKDKITQQDPKPMKTKQANVVQTSPFDDSTTNMNNLTLKHDTTILDVAQDSLGLYEITYNDYLTLKQENPEELQKTQYKVIGNHGSITDAWCAHTISYLAKESGMDIGGHKSSVQSFINWAGPDYKSIKTTPMTAENYIEERKSRAKQIKAQLSKMKEGDFIIFKANASNGGTYLIETDSGVKKSFGKSHIGLLESIDLEKGIITVIEGNANKDKSDAGLTRSLVTTSSEGLNGAQSIGEFQEVNRRDGLIRKQYSIEELAALGYTGYIDNSSRITRKS